ncbi:polysaccharide deacetylase family protein [Paraflavitalea soli]|nr:polysaccharide deacetylase family protein [Paraflavitalea soli]
MINFVMSHSTISLFSRKQTILLFGAAWALLAMSVSLPPAHSLQQTKPALTDSTTLYLTFDDGIIPESEALDSLVRTEEVPVTVFWIGKFVLWNDTTRRIWQLMRNNPWIEPGNHSYSHANNRYFKYYQDPQQVVHDFQLNADSLQFTGKLARLPGRNAWRINNRKREDLEDCKAVADSLAAAGYSLFGWDIEWNYSSSTNQLEPAEDLLFRIGQVLKFHRSFMPRHIVILCHDPAMSSSFSITTLQHFIQQARTQYPYRFRFLSQYPAL